MDTATDQEAAQLGVRRTQDQPAWSLPLYLGSLDAGEIRFGWDDFFGLNLDRVAQDWHGFHGRELLRTISSHWNRWSIGAEKVCRIRFDPTSGDCEPQRWNGEISWLHQASDD